ncbi:MAG: GNAT family N-acetyltransferase [candidate division WS1 bacterium]|jgi:GNAT superfamily N-acetyltransferase|nr:GNAT family N-acetyltransferase [candidate division WS1 bacterium]
MAPADFSYHILKPPFPRDFVAWYPYIRPEVLGPRHERWRRWLLRVIDGETGMIDRMIAARNSASGEWVGVVWTSTSITCPELAHFGWFFVEDGCQGSGVGGHVIETSMSMLRDDGVRMVMLPTQLENERAIGMYYRRGWQLSITDPSGGVWMVHEPPGYYRSFFAPDPGRPIRASAPEPVDFVALDYLLSRPAAPIRLLPLGLVGNRRFISFTHDWDEGAYRVARQAGRPLALAAALPVDGWHKLDVFGLDRRAMSVAAAALVEELPKSFAEVAATDSLRRRALEDAGMVPDGVHSAQVAGAKISLCRYSPGS